MSEETKLLTHRIGPQEITLGNGYFRVKHDALPTGSEHWISKDNKIAGEEPRLWFRDCFGEDASFEDFYAWYCLAFEQWEGLTAVND